MVYSTQSAAQGELPEGQERVPWGMTVPRNFFVRVVTGRTYEFHLMKNFTVESADLGAPLLSGLHNLSRRGGQWPPTQRSILRFLGGHWPPLRVRVCKSLDTVRRGRRTLRNNECNSEDYQSDE